MTGLGPSRSHGRLAALVLAAGSCAGLSLVRGGGNGRWHEALISLACGLAALVAWQSYSHVASRVLRCEARRFRALDAFSFIPFLAIPLDLALRRLDPTLRPPDPGFLLALCVLIKLCAVAFLAPAQGRWRRAALIGPLGLLLLGLHWYGLRKEARPTTSSPRPAASWSPALLPAEPLRAEPAVSYLPGAGAGIPRAKVELAGQIRSAFLPPRWSPIEIALRLESPAEIVLGFGLLAENPRQARGNVLFRVVVRRGDQAREEELFSQDITAAESARDGWWDVRLALSPPTAGKLRLSLQAAPTTEAPTDDIHPVWSYPDLAQSTPKGRRNVVLISLDTLRADHVGVLGYARPTTPHIDRLARSGLLFTQAVSQATWTLPSHMSLLTALYPTTHGVTGPFPDDERPMTYPALPASDVTLAESLRRAGYRTAAFTGGGTLAGVFGFARGFDVYDETLGELAPGAVARVGAWLERQGGPPFFLFLHTFKIHAPYTGTAFAPPPAAGEREVNIARYDGDIREADEQVGRLVGELRRLRLYDDTLIVILSDHGEEFADHHPGYINDAHGDTLYEELLRVPLLLALGDHAPFPQGLVVREQVQLIDVMPTVLELLGVPAPSGLQGRSLVPYLSGAGTLPPLAALGECTLGTEEKRSLRLPPYKYIQTTRRPAATGVRIADLESPLAEELFDLTLDPTERRNLGPARPDLCLAERRRLVVRVAAALGARPPSPPQVDVPTALADRLRALGYVH